MEDAVDMIFECSRSGNFLTVEEMREHVLTQLAADDPKTPEGLQEKMTAILITRLITEPIVKNMEKEQANQAKHANQAGPADIQKSNQPGFCNDFCTKWKKCFQNM